MPGFRAMLIAALVLTSCAPDTSPDAVAPATLAAANSPAQPPLGDDARLLTSVTKVPLTPAMGGLVHVALRKALKDPTARVGPIVAGRNADGFLLACGSVTTKGQEPRAFNGVISEPPPGRVPRDFAVAKIAADRRESDAIMAVCQKQGLALPP